MPKGKKKPRAPKAVVISRITQVQELLLSGQTRKQILRHAAEHWKLAERQVDDYIAKATEEIEEANASSAERHLALITANLWVLYRDNRSSPSLARELLMDIAKLRGVDKEEMTLHLRKYTGASDDDLISAAVGGA